MDDLISRYAAIESVEKESQVDGAYGYMDTKSIIDLLEDLPTVQPEIIHCQDCKHCQRENYDVWISQGVYDTRTYFWCRKLCDVDQKEQIEVMLDDYCSWAERRENETN